MLNKNLAELEKVAIQNDLIPSVNSNSHICLDFSDPVSVFSKGRHEAVQKAQEKAFDLASAGGLNLGKITSVTDNMYGFGGDNSPYSNYCSTNLGSGRVIEEQEVAVSVSVNFEIK
jgi:uncharacterized protein YggE